MIITTTWRPSHTWDSLKNMFSSLCLRSLRLIWRPGLTEVTKAIAKLKNSRAGVIPSHFLKDTSSRIAFPLASIFSESLEIGALPDNLKLARITAIFKGEGSRSNPDHYRPISVLSVIARLFEKIVQQQLYDFLKGSLSVTQSRFKSGFSTESNLPNTTKYER